MPFFTFKASSGNNGRLIDESSFLNNLLFFIQAPVWSAVALARYYFNRFSISGSTWKYLRHNLILSEDA
jgi:hypothetical protein